jgi:hypothetical protein
LFAWGPVAQADTIHVDLYTDKSPVGYDTGIDSFTGYIGSFDTNGIAFGASTGFNWHPAGVDPSVHNGAFGADFTGSIYVPSTGNHSLELDVDDTGILFIDGTQVYSKIGPSDHSLSSAIGTDLTEGHHSFEIKYYNFGGGSGVDLYLDNILLSPPADPSAAPLPTPAWAGITLFGGLGLLKLRCRATA